MNSEHGSRMLLQALKQSAFTPGTRVMMHLYNNTVVKRGKIRMSFPETPKDCRRVEWDDGYGTSTEPVARLELEG